MPQIPDRWIPYKACGKVIEGTRFICFKVPLRKSVQERVKEIVTIWDIPALLKEVPNLGAVIDLTNTSKYYDPQELRAAGLLYKKILMPGRILPPKDKVTEFTVTVDEFLGTDCDFLVGVHCTHGLNRTGYMVCRYMRDRLGIPAKEAIKRFEKARGYQIERDNYIAHLLNKTPPPPDVGKATVVKPLASLQYKSPLEYENDECSSTRYFYNSGNNRSRFGGNSTSQSQSYVQNHGSLQSHPSRHGSSPGNNFDYRHDY